MSPRKTMIGILAAGAASLTLAAGLSGTALAQPPSPGCETARAAFADARSAEAKEKGERDAAQEKADQAAENERTAAKELRQARDNEAAVHADPGSTQTQKNKATSDRIAAEGKHRDAKQASSQASKKSATEDAEYKTAQADTAGKGAAADKACESKPGQPGADGKPGAQGDPQRVIVEEHRTQINHYGSSDSGRTEAPKPIVQSGGDYPAVTG